ncbi:MAG TPA: radical SAM protein [Nitrospirota bacterium]|nr:radical SAM protein [Nitrospirota bacterium]
MPEYEGTVIRPPSEADSLILQYTIGCSHNRCVFCPAYKDKRYRVRSLAEMEREIRECAPAFSDVRRVFLADGDALAAPQQELLALFTILRAHFPHLQRMGMYANASSILGKSNEELEALRSGGLGILYLGVESGDDKLLAWMRKGVTAEQTREAGLRVKKAGIKLSVTVLLGIGGSERSSEHARLTGKLLTEMNPDYVGALTTMVVPGTPLFKMEKAGGFTLPGPFAVLQELAEMLEHTDMHGLFFSNHASNYLPLKVRMPADRGKAIETIRRFIHNQDRSALRADWMRGL